MATFAVLAGAVFFVVKEANSPWGFEWLIAALAGAYGVAGLLLQLRSLVAQVIARGALWVAVVPSSIYCFERIASSNMPDATALSTALVSASALALARPMLHTESARAQLAPAHCRSLFLTSAIWAAIAALPSLVAGGFFKPAEPAVALGALLLATALGVVRMRGWSIFTGIASSILALVLMATTKSAPMMLVAAPGLLLIAALVRARSKARRVTQRAFASQDSMSTCVT